MEVKFTAQIVKDAENLYTGWMHEIKGVVAQGETIEEVEKDLLKLLKIRLKLISRGNKEIIEGHKNHFFKEYTFK